MCLKISTCDSTAQADLGITGSKMTNLNSSLEKQTLHIGESINQEFPGGPVVGLLGAFTAGAWVCLKKGISG